MSPSPRAKKRFGQHFLHEQGVIGKLIDAIAPQTGDRLIEIGPGPGALTFPLLEQAGQLTVIEVDRDMHANLQRSGLTLIGEDALKVDLVSLADGMRSLRLVGNLPYNISTPLIFHFLKTVDLIKDMHFMLQKEVVQRIAASPGGKDYGRLTVMVQYACEATSLFHIAPGAFTPPPKVDSAVVRLIPRNTVTTPAEDFAIFGALVAAAFSQRRKTLRNSIRQFLSADDISSLDIDPSHRAEVISVENFVRLANLATQRR